MNRSERQQELLERLVADVGKLRADLETKLGALEVDVNQVKRTVNAIETLPMPYGRPKSYVSATEYHSVSNPKRVRQGFTG